MFRYLRFLNLPRRFETSIRVPTQGYYRRRGCEYLNLDDSNIVRRFIFV